MAKKYVMILGIIFLVIGILGFIGPLVPNGNLFGVFAVSTSHNVIYLLSGILGLAAALAAGARYAPLYAKVAGVLYGLVAVFGLMTSEGNVWGLFSVNPADNILHLAIAAPALYVGFASGGSKTRQTAV